MLPLNFYKPCGYVSVLFGIRGRYETGSKINQLILNMLNINTANIKAPINEGNADNAALVIHVMGNDAVQCKDGFSECAPTLYFLHKID